METTIIDSGNIQHFKELLLPDAVQLLQEGKPLFALGLIEDGIACGALAGGPIDNSFRLRSFFVAPDYRRRGGASKLLQSLQTCMAALESLYEITVNFSVLNEEHDLFLAFLEAKHFVLETEQEGIHLLSLGELSQHAYFSGQATISGVHPFSKLSPDYLRDLDRSMRAKDGAPLSVPLEQAELDTDLSVAILDGNHIDAFLLFDFSCCGMLTMAYADSGQKHGSTAFSALLRTAYQIACHKYPPETKVAIQPVTALSAALIRQLAPQSSPVSYTACLRFRDAVFS